jgi:glycosyltransferase involved in cell wall biosynthesis
VTVANTTVVIPVWDEYVAERLREALQSLKRQSPTPEIIVVDNASAVAVPETEGVSVVRAPRRLPLGAARNLGLAQVKTPFVVFWDADDLMVPGALGFLEKAIAAKPGLAAFGAAVIEEPSGRRHRFPRRWIARLTRAQRIFAFFNCLWSLYPTTGATIIDADLARAAGGFSDSDSGDDWCLGVSLAFRGRIGWSERPGRIYALHGSSIWARHSTVRFLLRHSQIVRNRIRTDPGIPRSVKRLLPVVALAQWWAILAHEALELGRRARKRDRGS